MKIEQYKFADKISQYIEKTQIQPNNIFDEIPKDYFDFLSDLLGYLGSTDKIDSDLFTQTNLVLSCLKNDKLIEIKKIELSTSLAVNFRSKNNEPILYEKYPYCDNSVIKDTLPILERIKKGRDECQNLQLSPIVRSNLLVTYKYVPNSQTVERDIKNSNNNYYSIIHLSEIFTPKQIIKIVIL